MVFGKTEAIIFIFSLIPAKSVSGNQTYFCTIYLKTEVKLSVILSF
jgi:hypothetical protein